MLPLGSKPTKNPTWPVVGPPRARTTIHPGWKSGTPSPHFSQERAKADRVPCWPLFSTQKFTNAEHHGTESGIGPNTVELKYSVIRAVLSPRLISLLPVG